MDLILLYKALLRRKWILIFVPILSAAASIYFTKDFKRMYKSTAQLSTGFTVSQKVSVTEEKFNLYQMDIKFNNLIETVNSPTVFGLLSYRLLLHDLENKEEAFRTPQNRGSVEIEDSEAIELLKKRMEALEVLDLFNDRERKVSDLLKVYKYDYKSLREAIQVFRIQGTDYLQIVGFTERPKLSAEAVNILCEEFLKYYGSREDNKSAESVKTFAALMEKKKEELKAAEQKLKDFKAENGIINLDAASESQIGQITELENEKDEVSRKLMGLRLELSKINRDLTKAGESSSGKDYIKLRAELNRLNQLSEQPGPNQQMYRDSANIIRAEMQRNLGDPTVKLKKEKEDVETSIELSNRHLGSINRRLSQLRGQVGTSATVQADLNNLDREVTRASEEYLSAQDKYNTALDLSNINNNKIKQVLFGQPPIDPEPSKRIIVTALSGVASFVLCILFIVFIEYIDVSIKSPSNFQRKFDLTFMGSLNKVKLKKKQRISSIFENEKKPKKDVQTFREQLRKLRYEIQHSGKHIFLVTSNKPGEGKSLFVEALANGLSLSRQKILLIDANFSNNTLTQTFEAKGTLETLGGKEEQTGKLEDHISQTDINNVDIIGCEGGDFSPSEIFDFVRFKESLELLRETYDYIFIESPALNYFTDTKELVQFADRVIAVYSAESVIKQLDNESMNFFRQLSAKFLGVVLNMVKVENMNQ